MICTDCRLLSDVLHCTGWFKQCIKVESDFSVDPLENYSWIDSQGLNIQSPKYSTYTMTDVDHVGGIPGDVGILQVNVYKWIQS